jgi:hypothetical protein
MHSNADVYHRNAEPLVLQALADTRVVFVAGARQVGKSTLAQGIARSRHPAEEFSLDVRASARQPSTTRKVSSQAYGALPSSMRSSARQICCSQSSGPSTGTQRRDASCSPAPPIY